jgi:hypothetical protein
MPTLKLTIQITEEEAAKLKDWQLHGLVESDDEILDSIILIRTSKKSAPAASTTRRLSLTQGIVISIGVLIICGMLLFPPYRYNVRSGGGFAGYGLIINPTTRFRPSFTNVLETETSGSFYLDTSTLLAQILIVSLLTGTGAFLPPLLKRG